MLGIPGIEGIAGIPGIAGGADAVDVAGTAAVSEVLEESLVCDSVELLLLPLAACWSWLKLDDNA